jgi:succinylarginine dihydrolase
MIADVVKATWPEQIAPADLADPALWQACRGARLALLEALGLAKLAEN